MSSAYYPNNIPYQRNIKAPQQQHFALPIQNQNQHQDQDVGTLDTKALSSITAQPSGLYQQNQQNNHASQVTYHEQQQQEQRQLHTIQQFRSDTGMYGGGNLDMNKSSLLSSVRVSNNQRTSFDNSSQEYPQAQSQQPQMHRTMIPQVSQQPEQTPNSATLESLHLPSSVSQPAAGNWSTAVPVARSGLAHSVTDLYQNSPVSDEIQRQSQIYADLYQPPLPNTSSQRSTAAQSYTDTYGQQQPRLNRTSQQRQQQPYDSVSAPITRHTSTSNASEMSQPVVDHPVQQNTQAYSQAYQAYFASNGSLEGKHIKTPVQVPVQHSQHVTYNHSAQPTLTMQPRTDNIPYQKETPRRRQNKSSQHRGPSIGKDMAQQPLRTQSPAYPSQQLQHEQETQRSAYIPKPPQRKISTLSLSAYGTNSLIASSDPMLKHLDSNTASIVISPPLAPLAAPTVTVASPIQPSPSLSQSSLTPLAPEEISIMEQHMREMVEKMRQYQSRDPALFSKVWEDVKKPTKSIADAPPTTSPNIPTAVAANTSSSSIVAVTPHHLLAPQQVMRSKELTRSTNQNGLQADMPTSKDVKASDVYQGNITDIDSSRNKVQWPDDQKSALAAAAVQFLVTPTRPLSEAVVRNLLDENPNFVQLCEEVERMGYTFERSMFAKALLAATPTVTENNQIPHDHDHDHNDTFATTPTTTANQLHKLQPAQPEVVDVDELEHVPDTSPVSSIAAPPKIERYPQRRMPPNNPYTGMSPPLPGLYAPPLQNLPPRHPTPQSIRASNEMRMRQPISVDFDAPGQIYVSPALVHRQFLPPIPNPPPVPRRDVPKQTPVKFSKSLGKQVQANEALKNAAKPSQGDAQSPSMIIGNRQGARTLQTSSKLPQNTCTSMPEKELLSSHSVLSNTNLLVRNYQFEAYNSPTLGGNSQTDYRAPDYRSRTSQMFMFSNEGSAQKDSSTELFFSSSTKSPNDTTPNTACVLSSHHNLTANQIQPSKSPYLISPSQTEPEPLKDTTTVPASKRKQLLRQAPRYTRPQAARRSSYDPKTIAFAVLININRHSGKFPGLDPLNGELAKLKALHPEAIDNGTDLEQLLWKIYDPKPYGDESDEGTIDDLMIADDADTTVEQLQKSKKDVPKSSEKSQTRSIVDGQTEQAMPPTTEKRNRGRLVGWKKGLKYSDVRKAASTSESGSANGTPGKSAPKAGNDQGSANAGISKATLSQFSLPRKRRMSDESLPPGRNPGRKVIRDAAIYPVFKCKWENCVAELHSLETLEAHIVKKHAKMAEFGGYPCLWEGCWESLEKDIRGGNGLMRTETSRVRLDFSTEEEWWSHMATHLSVGSGGHRPRKVVDPQKITHSRASTSDAEEMLRRMSVDREGRVVTPLSTPAPEGYEFTPPPGFRQNQQFKRAHETGMTPFEKKNLVEEIKRHEILGAGMEWFSNSVPYNYTVDWENKDQKLRRGTPFIVTDDPYYKRMLGNYSAFHDPTHEGFGKPGPWLHLVGKRLVKD